MQKWRRVAGVIIAFMSIANLFVFGLPGHIYNANQWLAWIRRVDVSQVAALVSTIIGIFVGSLLVTSDLWWPRISQWIRRNWSNREPRVVESTEKLFESAVHPNSFEGRLRACYPQIKRCRELVEPYRGEYGVPRIEWQQMGFEGNEAIRDLNYELGYIARRLDSLYIPSPGIADGPGTNVGDLNERLQQWGWFLEKLETAVLLDDLDGARLLWTSPPSY